MNIGVNTLFLIPGEVGGSETYLRSTLRAILEGHPDVSLTLFTNRENDAALRDAFCGSLRCRTVRLDFNASNRYARIIREQCELPLRVMQSGVDVLWSPGYTGPLFAARPQAVSVLDLQYKEHPEDLAPLARLVTSVLVPLTAYRSRAIITLSDFSRRAIIRHFGIRAEKIHVTPLAADSVFSRDVSPAVRTEAEALRGGPGPYVLVVANTYPHKNVHVAVEAFGRVMGAIPHRLVLVGQPRRGEPRVEQAIAALPAGGRVTRIRHVGRDVLAALYAGADVMLFPSLYEGFGLPVLEAMLAGVPVVTGRGASIPEVGGRCAEYVDPPDADGCAQALRRVLAWSAEERAERVRAGRAWAAGFSWERTAAETVAVLRQIRGR